MRKGGGYLPAGITYAPLFDRDGHLVNLIANVRDITKFREAEELKSTFISIVSHELRTPLMIAARRYGAAPIVRFLLDHKANPNPNAKPDTESSPLMEAITAGDATIVEMLMKSGADAAATSRNI